MGVKIHVFSSVHVCFKIPVKQKNPSEVEMATGVLWNKFGGGVPVTGTDSLRLCVCAVQESGKLFFCSHKCSFFF